MLRAGGSACLSLSLAGLPVIHEVTLPASPPDDLAKFGFLPLRQISNFPMRKMPRQVLLALLGAARASGSSSARLSLPARPRQASGAPPAPRLWSPRPPVRRQLVVLHLWPALLLRRRVVCRIHRRIVCRIRRRRILVRRRLPSSCRALGARGSLPQIGRRIHLNPKGGKDVSAPGAEAGRAPQAYRPAKARPAAAAAPRRARSASGLWADAETAALSSQRRPGRPGSSTQVSGAPGAAPRFPMASSARAHAAALASAGRALELKRRRRRPS